MRVQAPGASACIFAVMVREGCGSEKGSACGGGCAAAAAAQSASAAARRRRAAWIAIRAVPGSLEGRSPLKVFKAYESTVSTADDN